MKNVFSVFLENKFLLMKWFFKFIFIPFVILILVYLNCIKKPHGFSYQKIHSDYGYNARWDFGPPSQTQEKLLDELSCQSFTLLGSGKKCYAFVSVDGTTVIKFFKQKHLKNSYFLHRPPIPKPIQPFRNEILNKHNLKRHALYQSYQIAYERIFDQTGVLYLHLTKTKGLNRTIHLKTPHGKQLTLKLDNIEFLIQKRAFSILDTMKQYPEKRKEIIVSIVDLIVQIAQKGIKTQMINCEEDLGFLEGKVIQIGGGKFYPSIRKPLTKEELQKQTLPIKKFLEKTDPNLLPYLEAQIQSALC